MSAPEEGAGITIVGVEARNFHRLEVAQVEHVPGQGLVRVTGRNRQGKTSLLSAIAATLGGAAEVRAYPIRVRADGAEDPEEPDTITKLHLSNGFQLTRRYTEANPKGYLTVEGPDGGRHGQAKLDGWLGALAFDPLGFYGLKADRQRDVLLSLGKDPELPAKLAEVRARQAAVYSERTPWIAQQRAASRITQPAGERPVAVDTKAELRRMGELQVQERRRGDLTREYERAVERRVDELAGLRREAALGLQAAEVEKHSAQRSLEAGAERVAELERELERARDLMGDYAARCTAADQAVDRAAAKLNGLPDEQDARDSVLLPELPEDPAEEMAAVTARIAAAEATLAGLEPWRRWDEAQASLEEANAKVVELTEAHVRLKAEEQALVAAAGIPVPGLSFGEGGEPLLNGFPLEVASGADRIQLAVEVAVAANPELRVALVDEANDLDEQSLAELDRLARVHAFQVWACRLGLEGSGEVVVHDGEAYANDKPVALPSLPPAVLFRDGGLA